MNDKERKILSTTNAVRIHNQQARERRRTTTQRMEVAAISLVAVALILFGLSRLG